MRRRSKLILIALGVALTAAAFILAFGDTITRRKCQSQLRSIGCAIELYRETHNGFYPPNLGDIEDGLLESVLRCPGARAQTQTADKSTNDFDYVYVNWSQQMPDMTKTLPAGSPIVYDARLSDHKGKGINILLADGSVIWDEKALWLTHFAADHHGISVPR